MQGTEWDQRLVVRADGRNLLGHAGVVLLRKVADRAGLTTALAAVLPRGVGPGWRDRGHALVQLACAIVLGATNVLEAEQLQHHCKALFPRPVSDSTLRRTLEAIDERAALRIARARATVRRAVWTLIALRPGGFPWIQVAGRVLRGWYVLDLDATIVPCTSKKEGAAGTFKGSFGHHPLGARLTNTRECLTVLLRPGNAAANDVADHKTVLAAALRQLPLPPWSKLLIRIDGAAFSHALLEHLSRLSTSRRRVRWITGWAIHELDEKAIARLPKTVWQIALRQDGEVHEIEGEDGKKVTYQVAELTYLRDLAGWPEGTRLIVRRVKPSRRDAKKLTAFEKKTGWRYQIVATNIPAHPGLSGVAGSGQAWFLDALYRDHAEVEGRVKAIKRVGLALLPSQSWQLNAAWVLAATIAADLDAWTSCTTNVSSRRPSRKRSAASSTTCRPASLPTPAAAPSTWSKPGPGPGSSPPPGSAPPSFRPPPDGRPSPRRGPGRSRPATPSGPWNPTPRSVTRRPTPTPRGTKRSAGGSRRRRQQAEESRSRLMTAM